MNSTKLPIRRLKKEVLACLKLPDYEAAMDQICRFPHRQVVNPLFSFLYSLDEQIKWRAVSAMGSVVWSWNIRYSLQTTPLAWL